MALYSLGKKILETLLGKSESLIVSCREGGNTEHKVPVNSTEDTIMDPDKKEIVDTFLEIQTKQLEREGNQIEMFKILIENQHSNTGALKFLVDQHILIIQEMSKIRSETEARKQQDTELGMRERHSAGCYVCWKFKKLERRQPRIENVHVHGQPNLQFRGKCGKCRKWGHSRKYCPTLNTTQGKTEKQ